MTGRGAARLDLREFAAGATMVAAGLFFVVHSVSTLPIGTAFRMGPGYFPVLLGSILALIGIVIAVKAVGRASEEMAAPSWRAVGLIAAAVVAFGMLMPRMGLVVSLIVAIGLSAFASRRMTVWRLVPLAALLTLFCVAVFKFALNQPMPLFGPWLPMLGG